MAPQKPTASEENRFRARATFGANAGSASPHLELYTGNRQGDKRAAGFQRPQAGEIPHLIDILLPG
jgi:hypothetical protein